MVVLGDLSSARLAVEGEAIARGDEATLATLRASHLEEILRRFCITRQPHE